MYTFLNIFFILFLILTVAAFIVVAIGGPIWLSDIRLDLKYPSLNTREENELLKQRNATFPKRIVIILLLLIPVFLFSVVGVYFTNRALNEQTCLNNDGEWKTWDSGMQWECYNPNLINQGNNFRVITETPEN